MFGWIWRGVGWPLRRVSSGLIALSGVLVTGPVWAHVAFDGISSGESFVVGTTVELLWRDTIPHETTAYHLELIPAPGEEGIVIASDIAPSEHSYLWTVPNQPCSECALFIIQDNEGSDYTATHPIQIVEEGATAATDDMREASGTHVLPGMMDVNSAGDNGEENAMAEGGGGGCALNGAARGSTSWALGWILACALALTFSSRLRR